MPLPMTEGATTRHQSPTLDDELGHIHTHASILLQNLGDDWSSIGSRSTRAGGSGRGWGGRGKTYGNLSMAL